MTVNIYNFKEDIKRQIKEKSMRPECNNCDNQADFNFQENWCSYSLIDDKEAQGGYRYEELDCVNSGDNIFYCEECAEKEGYI